MLDDETTLDWRQWYRRARLVMSVQHGLKHVPEKMYRKPWMMHETIQQGVQQIVKKLDSIELQKYK